MYLDRVWVPVEVLCLSHDGLLAVELLLGHVEEVAVVVDQVLAHVRLGRRPGKVGGTLRVERNMMMTNIFAFTIQYKNYTTFKLATFKPAGSMDTSCGDRLSGRQ